MSKEPAYPCHFGCGMMVAFPEFHTPHCRNNPRNLKGAAKKHIESKFTKAELEQISRQGPMADRPVSRKRKNTKAKVKAKR